MNRDFAEMLAALSAAGAEYLLVGAHALAAHGVVRATGDLDVWIRPTADNASKVWRALLAFGAPLQELTERDLATPDVVFQIGVVPYRIDLLTSIDGVSFDEAWPNRTTVRVEGQAIPLIGRDDFLRNKRATGRLRDLADAEELEKLAT
ncbi:MAG: hypothetical protein ACJ79H_09810 [Myxococcales bacterium]